MRRWVAGPVVALLILAAGALAAQPRPRAAWLLRSVDDPADRRESRRDILDTPLLPGSLMKAIALAASLEAHAIQPDTARLCRRMVTHEGRRYTCSHPDLKRPLGPAEALAHSCNDYFLHVAQTLPRHAFNDFRAKLGLPPVASDVSLARAVLGLAGPRVTPRTLVDAFSRLVAVGGGVPVPMEAATRRVLLDGLRGAAAYGSASELAARSIEALAKTGTTSMPGGGSLGLVVAFTPAGRPARALIVVAPGGAGRDAVSIAADLLAGAGHVRLGTTDAAGRTQIEGLPLEGYVARVVAGEGQPDAPDAAQQALAIAARTYALAHRSRHEADGFDLCDTTHCQALRPATPASARAAAATAGRILVHRNQPAPIFYSASCGGRTEVAYDVWPGAPEGSSGQVQDDDACRNAPRWTSEIVVEELEHALRSSGRKGDRLGELRVMQRTSSGRVRRVRAEGFTPAELSGEDFRLSIGRALGWQRLKSTAFDVRRTPRGYTFEGRGSGHGVGLCVLGAGARAARGATAEEILRFYYPGLRVETHQSLSLPSATRADVLIGLPAHEEGDRSLLLRLVRGARDELAARALVAAPPVIRVTVHSTVESFGRATGQPWWTAGATNGALVHLLPLEALKREGQLERTVRHEVAHVMLDAALAGRPLWIREGAALYFGGGGSGSSSRMGPCPADAELARPGSRVALRDAYARAEGCFRRQIAAGREWRDVR